MALSSNRRSPSISDPLWTLFRRSLQRYISTLRVFHDYTRSDSADTEEWDYCQRHDDPANCGREASTTDYNVVEWAQMRGNQMVKQLSVTAETLSRHHPLLEDPLEYQFHSANSHDATREDLEVAKQLLARFAVVGIAEQFAESMVLIRHVFGWEDIPFAADPPKGVVKNKPPVPDDLTDKGRRLLQKALTLDLELYEFAKNLFRGQWAAAPDYLRVKPELLDAKRT